MKIRRDALVTPTSDDDTDNMDTGSMVTTEGSETTETSHC